MDMFCHLCGTGLPEDAVFCNRCGGRVQHTQPGGPAITRPIGDSTQLAAGYPPAQTTDLNRSQFQPRTFGTQFAPPPVPVSGWLQPQPPIAGYPSPQSAGAVWSQPQRAPSVVAPAQTVPPSAIQRLLIRIFQPALASNALFGVLLGGILAVVFGVFLSYVIVMITH